MNIIRVVAVVLCTSVPAAAQSHFNFFEPVRPPRTVQVMAHRGLYMLAPENSLDAVLACAADFIEWAEIDVQLSRDGQHVKKARRETRDLLSSERSRTWISSLCEAIAVLPYLSAPPHRTSPFRCPNAVDALRQ